MKRAFVVHTLDDAIYYADELCKPDDLVFCTHAPATSFLMLRRAINAVNISDLLTLDEMASIKRLAVTNAQGMLESLDLRNKERINEAFGMDIKLFYTSFSYMVYFQLVAYYSLKLAIEKIVENFAIEELCFFDAKINEMFETDFLLSDFIREVLGSKWHLVSFLKRPASDLGSSMYSGRVDKRPISSQIKTLKFNANFFLYNLLAKALNPASKKVLFFGQMYGLRAVLLKLTPFQKINIFSMPDGSAENKNFNFDTPSINDTVCLFLAKECVNFVESKIDRLLFVSAYGKELLRKNDISIAVWASPSAINPAYSVFFETLRYSGVKIVGAQHGNCYIDQYAPEHFYSDFDRCDYFFSYGFTNNDIRSIYPNNTRYPEIIPIGKAKINALSNAQSVKEPIDILFPITNTISLLLGGMTRLPFGVLCEVQRKILDFLASLDDKNVYVKPFAGSSEQNACIGSWNFDFKRMHYINDISLVEFLKKYAPKIVIIDYPASPLVDVMDLDTEIFLLADPLIPYNQDALEKLKKRAHCFDSVYELIAAVEMFLEGKLAFKRDDSYMSHYLYKPDTIKNAIAAINDIAKGKI